MRCPICRKRQVEAGRRGKCYPCYARARLASAPPCSADGCSKPARVRGLCEMHYARVKRAGMLPMPAPRKTPPRCSERDCRRQAVARGLCKHCYNARYRAGEFGPKPKRKPRPTQQELDRAARAADYGGSGTPLEVFMARQRAALASTGLRKHADFYGGY